MLRLLITGPTGNVGRAVIKCLHEQFDNVEIVAAVRDVDVGKRLLVQYNITFTKFDFADSSTYATALNQCDVLFLLRPPQISQVNKYFKPLINQAKKAGVNHIVFLSVQGVEKSRFIPHHKIESLIRKSAVSFTFLRPAYFMQNFTTTLLADLVNKRKIFLPAGKAKFTLIDVADIGNVASKVILNPGLYLNQSLDLTCNERLSFSAMAEQLSTGLSTKIKYQSPTLLRFFLAKRKEGVPTSFIFVMIMLHYLPRFQKELPITHWVKKISGQEPGTFQGFVADTKAELTKLLSTRGTHL